MARACCGDASIGTGKKRRGTAIGGPPYISSSNRTEHYHPPSFLKLILLSLQTKDCETTHPQPTDTYLTSVPLLFLPVPILASPQQARAIADLSEGTNEMSSTLWRRTWIIRMIYGYQFFVFSLLCLYLSYSSFFTTLV